MPMPMPMLIIDVFDEFTGSIDKLSISKDDNIMDAPSNTEEEVNIPNEESAKNDDLPKS